MSILTIKNWLDPVLRKKGAPVENIDEILIQLSKDMEETMLAASGGGLAANQVGVSLRFFVINLGIEKGEQNLVTVLNPLITASEDMVLAEEGCLSIPEVFAEVARSNRVEIKGHDLDGNEVRYEAEGYLARAFQHEMEHLEGHLFWDTMGKMKRDVLKRKFKKKLKEKET